VPSFFYGRAGLRAAFELPTVSVGKLVENAWNDQVKSLIYRVFTALGSGKATAAWQRCSIRQHPFQASSVLTDAYCAASCFILP
jgi:hypothetical protein